MANRRQFVLSLSGVAALSVTTDVSHLGRMRWLRVATSVPATGPHDRLQPDWYRRKIGQVQQKMQERKLNAMLLLDATNIIYTTGYFHLSTERPIAALIPESGEPVLFVPGLEVDQVQLWWVKDYESYFDFPGPVNRVRWIFERVASRGLAGARIGVEEPRPGRLHQMKLGAPKAEIVDAGDHTIFIAEVEEVVVRDGDPLLYYRGRYRSIEGPPRGSGEEDA